MATPSSLQKLARRAILTKAKNSAALTALVPASSINPDIEVAWPIVLLKSPRTLRLRAACVRGAIVSFDMHVFAGPRVVSGATVETGEDHAVSIASAIEELFVENMLTLDNGASCRTRFSDSQLLNDAEPDHWHWFSQLNCRVLSS